MALLMSSEVLTKDDLDSIFNSVSDSGVVTKLWKPKACEVFLFESNGTDDWRSDGYRWKQNGFSFISNKNKEYKKIHFNINTGNGLSSHFQKFVYRKWQGSDNHVIVHYIGNEDCAVDFPHGNSKTGLNFLATAASLRTVLSTAEHSYKDLVLSTREEPVQFQPRNKSQLKYYNESTHRICKDTLLALHEFAYMVTGFVWSITTYPDLVVVCCLPQLQALVVRLCQSDTVLLSYDTTFNVGDFYLSILCGQMQCFTSKPCIPLAFMLHDRKFQWMHNHFFKHVRKHFSGLRNAVIAVDGEASISKAIRLCTKWKVAMCSNHIIRDVEYWLKKHCASHAEIPVYKTNIRELLQCQTEVALLSKQAQLQSNWSEAFVTYYNENLYDRMKLAYNGYLCSLQIDCDYVTTNMSESMNAALKRLQNWREVSADMMVLTLYKLQLASYTDIIRSLKGFGPMEFVSSFDKADIVSDFDGIPNESPDPESIVDIIRSRLDNRETNHEPLAPVCTLLADDLNVCLVPGHKTFSVADQIGVAHSVRLFPKETCTCPANSTCCHIVAAKKTIGLETLQRRTICLTQLRKNARKKSDKRSGRKRARVGDLSFAAAPDSSIAGAGTDGVSIVESNGTVYKYQEPEIRPTNKRVRFHVKEPLKQSNADNIRQRINISKERRNGIDLKGIRHLKGPQATSTPMKNQSEAHMQQLHIIDLVDSPSTVGEQELDAEVARALADDTLDENDIHVLPDIEETVWKPDLFLTLPDKAILENANEWLNDRLIYGGLLLLKKQCSHLSGFSDPLMLGAKRCSFENKTFIQILYNQADHWITATNIDCRGGVVRVYDSLHMVPTHTLKEIIAAMCRTSESSLEIQSMNVARQVGGVDCGLFALAYATSLSLGQDPVNVMYDQSKLRHHFLQCLLDGKMTTFPVTVNRTVKKAIAFKTCIKLYCICRQTYVKGQRMIQCHECNAWYHAACLALSDSAFEEAAAQTEYMCPKCMKST